jgi:hypothetical protein
LVLELVTTWGRMFGWQWPERIQTYHHRNLSTRIKELKPIIIEILVLGFLCLSLSGKSAREFLEPFMSSFPATLAWLILTLFRSKKASFVEQRRFVGGHVIKRIFMNRQVTLVQIRDCRLLFLSSEKIGVPRKQLDSSRRTCIYVENTKYKRRRRSFTLF